MPLGSSLPAASWHCDVVLTYAMDTCRDAIAAALIATQTKKMPFVEPSPVLVACMCLPSQCLPQSIAFCKALTSGGMTQMHLSPQAVQTALYRLQTALYCLQIGLLPVCTDPQHFNSNTSPHAAGHPRLSLHVPITAQPRHSPQVPHTAQLRPQVRSHPPQREAQPTGRPTPPELPALAHAAPIAAPFMTA